MRRITFAVMSTIAAVVLLFSYRTSLGPVQSVAAPTTGGAPAGVVGGTPPPNSNPNQQQQNQQQPNQQQQQPQQNSGPVTVNGSTAQTEQGPVQVQVTINAGKIVDVKALQRPSGDQRHDEISAFSLPKLRAQALEAQSSQIDGVSGATATSGGYRTSLQAALDAANFG
jgi:uncharacterized protein with FMN-binding domain